MNPFDTLSRRSALGISVGAVATGLLQSQAKAPAPPIVHAYTNSVSVMPGESVAVHTSTAADSYSVEIARLGAKREVVWTKADVKGKQHPIPRDASAKGCDWPASFQVTVPNDWTSGYYAIRCIPKGSTVSAPGPEAYIIVRPKQPGKRTPILLQLSTNTYNAYTNWGGYSLYSYNGKHKVQGRRVSFNRPQSSQFGQWELPFVAWAEKNGYTLDYCANSDLEFHPELLKDYRLVLSVGHDEYWSSPMRYNLEAYIGAGGNVAFFSGNTCCWQVRSEDNGRALVCWKQNFGDDPLYQKEDHALLSTLWSHHLVKRPENSLTGVGFLWGGYHRSHGQFMDGSGAFTAHRPEHWIFDGTKLKPGEAFGAVAGKYKVVGYECDGCELIWKEKLPEPTFRDGTPKGFEVLATAPAKWHPDDCEWYEKWEKGRVGNAVLGTYTRGGTVVTVGTTDWSHGLRANDAAVVRITENILNKLGKPA